MARNRKRTAEFKRSRSARRTKSQRNQRLSLERLEPRLVLATNVLSYHMDLQSTGVNNTETQLTLGNVNLSSFGRTSITPLDGQAYAEPLYVHGVNITTGNFQGVHNVVFAATEHDGLYAIDGSGGNILWYDSFLNPAISGVAIAGATTISSVPNGEVNSNDINPEIGITGTPTIDLSQNALFVITKTKQIVPVGTNPVVNHTHYVATLFKINIQNGAVIASHIIGDTDATSGYVYRTQTSAISPNQDPFVFGSGQGAITVGGQGRVYFNALRQMSRPGSDLVNGQLYTFWASHGDNGPYHGWVLKFDENTLALTGALNTTPNGGLGGIWQGGGIAPVDTHLDSNGNPLFYFETGNGTFDGNINGSTVTGLNAQGFPVNGNYGDAFVKVGVDATAITGWGNDGTNYTFTTAGDPFGTGYFIQFTGVTGATDINNQIIQITRTSAGHYTLSLGSHPNSPSGGSALTTQASQNVNGWGLKVLDYFSPQNNHALDGADRDLGSGGPIVLPDALGNVAHPHLLIGSGKEGKIYLIDRDNMGKFAVTDNVVEEQAELSGVLNEPAYFNNTIYYVPGYGGSAVTYSIANGSAFFSVAATHSTPDGFGNLVGSPTISANGTTNAIMWATDTGSNSLRAYNASPASGSMLPELWTSNQGTGNTIPGSILKFSVPTVADGQVFVGTSTSLAIYGPPVVPTSGPAAPSNPGATALSYKSVNVTWQDNSNNEDFFSIQRSTSAGGPFVEVGEASANATSFIDTNNVLSQTTYYYQIKAHNIFNGGTFSAPTSPPVSVTTPQAPPMGTGDGLAVKFWNDTGGQHLTGTPLVTRVDAQINYPPNSNQPAPGVGPTSFSAEWTGRIQAQFSETYTFYTESDDGVMLFIKPTTSGTYTQLINNWTDHAPTENTATFAMSGGQLYDIKMDLYNNGGPWEGELLWSSTSTPMADFVPQSQLYSGVAPAIPSGLTVVAASGTTANVNWNDNSNNETGFTLQRTNPDNSVVSVSLPANTTSYPDTGLTPGSTYSYRIQANNFVANSAFTAPVQITIPVIPPTPSNGHVTGVTATSVSIAWQLNSTNSTNAETGVSVFRKTGSSGTFFQIAMLPAGTTSYTDNGPNGAGLLTGQFYDYHIQAFNVAGYTDFTGANTDTLTLPPSGLSATAGVGLINLSWTAPSRIPEDGATYNVYRGTAAGAENATPIASGLTGTSYADVTATPGQPYFYVVKAVDAGGASAASNEVNSTAASSNVPAPSSLTATVVGTQINLSWSSVGVATSYKVYRGTSPGGEGITPIATGVTGTTYSDLNHQPGLSYYYQVTSVNGSGESARSVEASGVLAPNPPTNITAAVDDNGLDIAVDWTASPGAVTYNVFRSNTSGGEGSTPYATGISGTEFVDPNAATFPGTPYYYTIVAINAGGPSAQSAEAFIAAPPAAPATPTVSIRPAGNVALSWAAVTGATSYNVYRAATAGGEGTVPLATGLSNPSYVDSAVSSGGSFFYKLSALGLGGDSMKSGEASVTFTAGTPQGPASLLATSNSTSQVSLSWTAPAGTVTGYNIFRGTAPGAEGASPVNGSPIFATNYNDSGLSQNTHYYYTVRALNGSGAGPASNEATAATLPFIPVATITPLNPNTVTAGPNSMQIVFNEAVNGFTIASLSLSRSGGPNMLTGSQTLTTSDNTTFTLGNLSSLDVLGGNYTLTFTAAASGVLDGFGNSPNANATTNFIVNPTAPEVNAVYVSSSAWQQSFLNYLASNNLGDSQLGYRMMGGGNQLAALPWANINIVTVVFSRDVNVTTASLALVGSPDLAAPPVLSGAAYSYNTTTHVAQWVYHSSLTTDKYLLNIPSAAVTSKASGQALDGEFANGSGNLLPSGDATTGGDFNFRFNILPGDVDQNGAVNALDGANVRQHFLQYANQTGYNPFFDTYGKGAITGIDLTTVQTALFSALPNTDPTPPGQGGGAGAAAATAPNAAPSLSDTPPAQAATSSATGSAAATSDPLAPAPNSAGGSSLAAALDIAPPTSTAPTSTEAPGGSIATGFSAVALGPAIGMSSLNSPLHSEVVDSSLPNASEATSSSGDVVKSPAFQFVGTTSVNSLFLPRADDFHAGWLTARDTVFAELDADGPIAAPWKRVGRSKRATSAT